MRCEKINTQTFCARLTTDRYSCGPKLKKYLAEGIKEFEKQTKHKPGCMTLREVVPGDESHNAAFYFWNSKTAPHTYEGETRLRPYAQKAITTRDFLKHLIVEKKPKEQANIFESIYDALQVIPKKLKKSTKKDVEYMNNLTQEIYKALGENKELLSPMFKHITDIASQKKLTIEDINF